VKRAGAAASTQAGEVAKRLTAAERAAAAKAEAARKAAARKARAAAAAERMQRARHSIKAGVVTTADALGRAAGRLAQWSKRLGERAARTGARLSEEFAARQRVARAQAGPQLERARRSIKSGVEQAGESIGRGAGRLAGWSKRMGERASEAGARLAKEIAERRAAARHETKATAEPVEKKSAPAEDAANRGVAPAVVLLDAENPRTVKVTAGKKKVRKPHPKKSGRK
jgi:colicin import membrane protein